MDLLVYSREPHGRISRFSQLSTVMADKVYEMHRSVLGEPWASFYRVMLVDPGRADHTLRDTYDD